MTREEVELKPYQKDNPKVNNMEHQTDDTEAFSNVPSVVHARNKAEAFHIYNAWSIRRTSSLNAACYYLRVQGFDSVQIADFLAKDKENENDLV